MTKHPLPFLAGLLALTVSSGLAQQPGQGQPPPPAQGQGQGARGGQAQGQGQGRDRAPVPQGTASISGRVLTADTGRPVKRARVTVAGGGRGGRAATTDDQGRYTIGDLSAGNYLVTASKNGFVDAIFGQKRPLQQGTPVAVTDAQATASIDLRLTRGGVITGHVVDEDGEALARALVTVQRYSYLGGERHLTPAGGEQTDDRGQYRVFGLPPGDYYVSATAGGLAQMLGRGLQQLAAGIGGLAGGRGGPGGGRGGFGGAEEPEATGYAPTYYPGVVSVPEAGKITVAPGQEVSGIDFQIQLVPFATVSGVVAGADDIVPVLLVPQDASGNGPLGGQTLSGRTQADSTFSISNVPPGHYVAVARSGGRGGGDPKTGMQAIVVNGQNIGGVSLIMQPPLTMSGNITVESSGTPAPTDYSTFLVNVPEVTPLPFGGGGGPGGRGGGLGGGGGRAANNGTFQIGNLLPGRHYIRISGGGQAAAQGQGRGGAQGQVQGQWTLKSVLVGGLDVTDQAIDIKPGQNLENVTIVMSDRSTDVTGTVRDPTGAPVAALTVIAFSSDQQYWRAQSRRIQTSRSDATGAFHLRALPPGDYFIVAVDGVEQGEWFDPAYLEQARTGASRFTLSEGEKKTLDLRGPS